MTLSPSLRLEVRLDRREPEASSPDACPLCGHGAAACDCDARLAPFDLIWRENGADASCCYGEIRLAAACFRLLKKSHHFPRLFDRHGCPVKL